MTFQFQGEVTELQEGIEALKEMLGPAAAPGSEPIRIAVEHSDGPLEVALQDGAGKIRFKERVHFFRGLGLFAELASRESSFSHVEQPGFAMSGVMLDASRNAVMRVASIKKLLRMMALMGLNNLMLYTEDTYTVEDAPYFGYMRGRYSFAELKEADDYAELFGIEMMPCMQTLAHLKKGLQWDDAAELRDTDSILLADQPRTYEWIERMIVAASAPFRSKRIHIGMDEAHELGLGKYLDLNGYKPRFEIMNRHLREVLRITGKHGLQPMIWSDMYFRIASPTHDYYDLEAEIPSAVIEEMPADVQYVYWDYYHRDPQVYAEMLRRHKRFGTKPVFAGGVWTWGSIAPNYGVTFAHTDAALTACREEGIDEVFATLWGDGGQETNQFTGLLGLQLFAEHTYAAQAPEPEWLKRRLVQCTGCDAEAFLAMARIDETPGVAEGNPHTSNPSKFLLWQDVLLGLFDKQVEPFELTAHFARVETQLRALQASNPQIDSLLDYYAQLSGVLKVKWDIGLRMKRRYDQGDKAGLRAIARQLSELQEQVERLRLAHRQQWLEVYKPHGWEVLDIRYGGLAARLATAQDRLEQYASGTIACVEELEEQRLPFDWRHPAMEGSLGRCEQHLRISTANSL
ncbi:beta-N-acetylhexosaminidase [Paenibacillus sp. IB182496]|uniref:Beta-N-acetylhexosaminidase n=1 Tax=Paenibacillus sabuli TaxID=2772509 RepID=A0A927BTN3_9BACL|nr:beta-N-acetylhexosaminidase [Paenibacillus sabuli]MBD2845319.1 beta-N-acetylhexosaminidase [Paenibacillus sabuli]